MCGLGHMLLPAQVWPSSYATASGHTTPTSHRAPTVLMPPSHIMPPPSSCLQPAHSASPPPPHPTSCHTTCPTHPTPSYPCPTTHSPLNSFFMPGPPHLLSCLDPLTSCHAWAPSPLVMPGPPHLLSCLGLLTSCHAWAPSPLVLPGPPVAGDGVLKVHRCQPAGTMVSTLVPYDLLGEGGRGGGTWLGGKLRGYVAGGLHD